LLAVLLRKCMCSFYSWECHRAKPEKLGGRPRPLQKKNLPSTAKLGANRGQ
jgi:hypothetical protein